MNIMQGMYNINVKY